MSLRTFKAVLLMGILAVFSSSCAGGSDSDHAEKYKAAVSSLQHMKSVESSYKTDAGMGRTADVLIRADMNEPADLMALLKDAFVAIVNAAEGDPNVSLAIQVTSADGATAFSPTHLGYSGTGTLSSYRAFLKENPTGQK